MSERLSAIMLRPDQHEELPGLALNEVVTLDTQETDNLWDAALQAATECRPGQDPVEIADDLAIQFPKVARTAQRRFLRRGSKHNVLLFQGICPSNLPDLLPPTPDTITPRDLPLVVRAAELALWSTMLPTEPADPKTLGRGLTHHVLTASHEGKGTTGDNTSLVFHVEDASGNRCHYLGLLCLRGNPEAMTILASAHHLDLNDEVADVLRQPLFEIAPDIAHNIDQDNIKLPRVPILTGPSDDPEICYDALYQRPADPTDRKAIAALGELATALDRIAIYHTLKPGELIMIDNRRVVHGRTAFDGNRWLLRTMTWTSLRDQGGERTRDL